MNSEKNMFKTADGKNYRNTFLLICTLFLLWGLCNGVLGVLNKHFQNSLGVSKAQSAFVQGVWYAAYFLMALPSGWVARKRGYRGGILAGLAIVIGGCLLFVPMTLVQGSNALVFAAFLCALFTVAAGLTFLETVANPYTTLLGSADAAVARINLAQSCNAVGWILGPIIGGAFVLSKTGVANTSNQGLMLPYLLIAAVVAVLLLVFWLARVPELHAEQDGVDCPAAAGAGARSLLKERHFVLAVVSQFLYVAAQTGIFSFFINYVKDDALMPALPLWLAGRLPEAVRYLSEGHWRVTEYGAGLMLSIAFGFFTLGRFSGSAILRIAKPHVVLALYALTNVLLMGLTCLGFGWSSVAALTTSFFFMSIMYPTHFALAIRGLGDRTKLASSFMVTAIIGGSLVPVLMGWLSDRFGMQTGFLLPLVCFIFIALYGMLWPRLYQSSGHAIMALTEFLGNK